jgi:hypothetical protein
MSVVPFARSTPPTPEEPQSPASDRCLISMVRSELALHQALDVARSTIQDARRSEVAEALLAALRANREAIQRYLAVAYPDRAGHAPSGAGMGR